MKRRLEYIGIVILLAISGVFLLSHASYADPPDPGLELHWNFDEGSGTTALDSTGNGNVGTLFNGPTYVPGHDGLAILLNGVDQYVQTNTPLASLGTVDQPYALSAWVNIAQGVSAGNIVDISSNADGSGWCIPFLRLENGYFTATGWDTSGGVSAASTTLAATGQWNQVLTSWDATNGLRLFVNGILVASTPQSNYAAAGVPIYASIGLSNGACSSDQGFLNGEVDDVRIYSRALAPSDIETISTEGDPPVNLPAATTPSNAASAPTLSDTGTDVLLTSTLAAIVVTSAVAVKLSKYRQSR